MESAGEWYDKLLWEDKHSFIGEFEHPKHGMYYLWFCDGAYGISQVKQKPFCSYSSLSSLLKAKGF